MGNKSFKRVFDYWSCYGWWEIKKFKLYFGRRLFWKNVRTNYKYQVQWKKVYQKITYIYSSCSIDYDKDSEITKTFFQTVQNRLHYSVTGNTAAEIVYNRVDSEKELKNLNRIITMYLDYAELQAENHNVMTMNDWVEKLNAFL